MTLDNVAVLNESGEGINGVEAADTGSLTMNGGDVEMEGGSSGYAVLGHEASIALNGVRILNGSEAPDEAGGVESGKSPLLSLTNTNISVDSASSPTTLYGLGTEEDGSVLLTNDSIRQDSSQPAAILEESATIAKGLRLEMLDSASARPPSSSRPKAPPTSRISKSTAVGTAWDSTPREAKSRSPTAS